MKAVIVIFATSLALALAGGCSSSESWTASQPSEKTDSSVSISLRYLKAAPDLLVPAARIPGVKQTIVGSGPSASAILWNPRANSGRDVTVFLHAWLPVPPSLYGPWIKHLVQSGKTVIYPIYQDRESRPQDLLDNVVSGVRAALQRLPHRPPREVDAIGHTTGGALAFDYAAVAKKHGLPPARSVVAVYPGRNPGERIPEADLSHIPAKTRLVVITGPGNRLPNGAQEARDLLGAATGVSTENRSLIRASYPTPDGPLQGNREARRSFWVPADRAAAGAPR